MRHFLFPVGTLLIGLSVGVLTVLSRSPVVAVVIPLLFGLIAGASGLYLAREDITQADGRRRLGFVGVSVSALCLGLLSGLAGTFWVRTAVEPPRFEELVGLDASTPFSEQIYATEVRMLAQLMGADAERQAVIVRSALRDLRSQAEPEQAESPQGAGDLEGHVVAALEALAALAVPADAPEEGDHVAGLRVAQRMARELLALRPVTDEDPAASAIWRQGIGELDSMVDELVGAYSASNDAILALSDIEGALAVLLRYRYAIGAAREATIVVPQGVLLTEGRRQLIEMGSGRVDVASGSAFSDGLTVAEEVPDSRNFSLAF